MSLKEIIRKGRFKLMIILLLIILILSAIGGCATQSKYRKHRQIPCPCEVKIKNQGDYQALIDSFI